MSAFWIINILIFFLCSLIYKNRDEIEVLCIDNTNSLRGIFMLLMISHHVSICLGNDKDILVRILATLGGMLTGVYFFLSGYGNYMSYKRNCLKGMSWFGKRVFYIIVPFEICYPIISMLSKSSRGGVYGALTLTIPGATNWFIKVILGCYLIFFIIFFMINIPEYLKQILLVSTTIVYVLITIFIGANNVWWSSVLCFPLGVYYASNRVMIDKILARKFVIIMCFCMSLIFYVLFVKISMIFHILACLFGCLVVLILNKIVIFDSMIFRKLGLVSYEIYIIHSGFVAAIYNDTLNNFQVFNIYLFSIFCAFIVHKIANILNKAFITLIKKIT